MDETNAVDDAVGTESRWQKFVAATIDQPPTPQLVRAAATFESPGKALDVGAGAGRDTVYLLQRGWCVTAIDRSPAAIAELYRLDHQGLQIVALGVEDFDPPGFDLVNAQYSLPFIPRDRFVETVRRLRDSVQSCGVFAATFFGERDGWNVLAANQTFSTRDEIEYLFKGWDVIELSEVEEDGHLATGAPKHWHVFHLIARQRPR